MSVRRRPLTSTIHRASVTDADPEDVGSVSIDAEPMALADIAAFGKVTVLDIDIDIDIDNGNRRPPALR